MSRRFVFPLLVLICCSGFALLWGGNWLALGQPPKKQTELPEEEWDENYTPPSNNQVVPLPEDKPGPKTPQDRPSEPRVLSVDLREEARKAKQPEVRAFLTDLAVPHDIVTTKPLLGFTPPRGGQTLRVQPIPGPFAGKDPKAIQERLEVTTLDPQGKEGAKEIVTPGSIAGVQHYEQIALQKVAEFRSHKVKDLDRADQLALCEKVLTAVLRFHQSARARNLRTGPEWQEVEAGLRQEMLAVLLSRVEERGDARDWQEAIGLARRLAEEYTGVEDSRRLVGPLADLLLKAARREDASADFLRRVRDGLHHLETLSSNEAVLEPVREALKKQAVRLLHQAEEMSKDPALRARAQELARQAEQIDPHNTELRTFRRRLTDQHPILRVGVAQLPTMLSPARAGSNAERQCVDLLFESLVSLHPTGQGIYRYEPELALGRPEIIPLGRRFHLPVGAHWSDGRTLNAVDVRVSVEYCLQQGRGCGLPAIWGSLLERPRAGRDWVELTLTHGFLSPLSLMTCKILPRQSRSEVDDIEFAQNPVGSGPFTYKGPTTEGGQTFARFLANPYYSDRAGKAGAPRLQEIDLFAYDSGQGGDNPPLDAFRKHKLHVLLDVSADQARAFEGERGVRVMRPSPQIPNRRIYFLALNQRHPALANADRRRALAHAINRTQLLDAHFRPHLEDGKPDRRVHQVLDGPYPVNSWAGPERATLDAQSLDLYDPIRARKLAKQANDKDVLGGRRLTLKYPSGDPAVKAAMEALCAQVQQTLNLDIEPVARLPHELRHEVERQQDYDLAYYSYDFPDASYWLLPLLGWGPQGENYLGFHGEQVRNLLLQAMNYRSLKEVQNRTRAVHQLLTSAPDQGQEANAMPFVPLWQLDRFLVVDENVQTGPLDPLEVFADVENWRIASR
jgi:ABC-type oligopeptide transport system substrate-binding subunit